MPLRTWRQIGICCLIVAGSATPRQASADANPVVTIKIEGSAEWIAPTLARAQEVASEIYQRAGITLRWSVEDATDPDTVLTIVLAAGSAIRPGLSSDALGVAPSPGDGTRGTIAYVFIDRITTFARSNQLAISPVLGCALAHEIGHLLLPANAHRRDSIMRADWEPAFFPPRVPGIVGFASDQARLLRLRVRRPE